MSIGLGLYGCMPAEQVKAATESAPTASSSDPVELPRVTTVAAVKKPITQRTVQPGRVEAFLSAPLFPRVTGYVKEVLVDIGDRVQGPRFDANGKEVSPGQPLVVISAPDIQEQLQQAKAALQQAEAEAIQAETVILVAKASVQSAQALIELAKADAQKTDADVKRWSSEFERVSMLSRNQAVTVKVTDETEHQFRSAQAGRSAALANIRSVEARAVEAEVGVKRAEASANAMRARVTVAEAAVRQAQAMVDFLTLRAPFDGTITQRQVDPGRLVQLPNATERPLLTVMQADTVRLFVEVPEADAVLIEPGREATIRIPSLPGKTIAGKVTRAAWSLETGNRTLQTEIDLPNPDGTIRPGMFAQVNLAVSERPEALVVPQSSVVVIEGQSTCMVVTPGGQVEARAVQTGLRGTAEVEITSGLQVGEKVISANTSAFKSGQKVQVASP